VLFEPGMGRIAVVSRICGTEGNSCSCFPQFIDSAYKKLLYGIAVKEKIDMSKYYKVEKLSASITRITCATQEMMYLVEGKEKAALIDSGTGYGNLDVLIRTLTDLPLMVLNTHGHFDHAGGDYYFDEVYIHPKDIEIIREQGNYKMRSEYVNLIAPELYKTMTEEDYAPVKQLKYIPIYDGDVIDLDGVELEVIGTPGHTEGSLCFLDKKENVLFSGDACNQRTFLFLNHSTSVVTYMDTLKKMLEVTKDIKHIYNAHDSGEVERDCIENVLNCCIDILNGKDDHVPFCFMNMTGYTAKAIVNEVERADGRHGNVIYNKNKIY
jgi:hydroxyacylglutathione hydrolase